jgi:hypothetical protein
MKLQFLTIRMGITLPSTALFSGDVTRQSRGMSTTERAMAADVNSQKNAIPVEFDD